MQSEGKLSTSCEEPAPFYREDGGSRHLQKADNFQSHIPQSSSLPIYWNLVISSGYNYCAFCESVLALTNFYDREKDVWTLLGYTHESDPISTSLQLLYWHSSVHIDMETKTEEDIRKPRENSIQLSGLKLVEYTILPTVFNLPSTTLILLGGGMAFFYVRFK